MHAKSRKSKRDELYKVFRADAAPVRSNASTGPYFIIVLNIIIVVLLHVCIIEGGNKLKSSGATSLATGYCSCYTLPLPLSTTYYYDCLLTVLTITINYNLVCSIVIV